MVAFSAEGNIPSNRDKSRGNRMLVVSLDRQELVKVEQSMSIYVIQLQHYSSPERTVGLVTCCPVIVKR